LMALQSNSAAMELLAGKKQEKLTWFMNDRQCSGIPDVYLPALKRWPDNSSGRVVELKSARSVNPDYFPYDSRKFGYHVQLSWYRNALATLGLVEPNAGCFIVAVESSAPYPVTIFELTERALLEGEKLWRLWFERLLVCEASNTWPEYTQARVPLDVPDSESLTLTIEGEEVEV